MPAPESRLRYFVAASIDGFIATPDGGVDWLQPFQKPQPGDEKDEGGWQAFAASIGGVISGRKTYEKMAGFGFWKGSKSPAVIVTSQALDAGNPLVVANPDPVNGLAQLRDAMASGDIWLLGGGQLASGLAAEIDSIELHVVPVILGAGIPMFAGPSPMVEFEAVTVRKMPNGLVRTFYERKP